MMAAGEIKNRSAPYPGSQEPPNRRERRRLQTRERIFRAALKLFAERGFLATAVGDITEAADVGKGTFFNYFPTKEHIFDALGELQLAKLEAFANRADSQDLSIRQLLRRAARALAEEPGRSPALVRSMLQAIVTNDAVRKAIGQKLERARRLLAGIFETGQRRGEIRADLQPMELARVFQQAFFGTLWVWSIYPSQPLAAWFSDILTVFWSGIEERPKARGNRRHSA
jgi:AcrR family transcriptional regulator